MTFAGNGHDAFVLTVLMSIASFSAYADNWTNVRSKSEHQFVQLDTDSIASVGDGKYSARWRGGTSPTQAHFLDAGEIDCNSESITVSSTAIIDTNPNLVASGVVGSEIDYSTGTATVNHRPSDFSDSNTLMQYRFPGPGDTDDAVIKAVCQREIPVDRRLQSGKTFQDGIGCAKKPRLKSSDLCKGDSDSLDAAYLLYVRLEQIQSACGTSIDNVGLILNDLAESITECKDATGCLPEIQRFVTELGADLAGATLKQPCKNVGRHITTSTENQKNRDSVSRFGACVRASIPILDDRLSPVDVIAAAVHAVCQKQLTPTLTHGSELMKRFLPDTVAAILIQRKRESVPRKLRSAPMPSQT